MRIFLGLILGCVLISLPFCLMLMPSGRAFLKSAQAGRQQAKESLAKKMKLLSQYPGAQKLRQKISSSDVSDDASLLVKRRWSITASPLIRLVSRWSRAMTIAAIAFAVVMAGQVVSAQLAPPFPSLKTVPVPEPDNLGDFGKNKTAALALGKSFFWDMQVGSDGIQSCATCHFQAGVDNRSKHQLST